MPTFFTCTCGAIHRANTRSYAAPAPVMSTSRQHNSFLRRASSNTEYLAPAFVAYAATLATVTGGFGLSLSNPPSSVDHACRVLCIHVHSATVAVVLWLNFRLLICNVVHCAAPRCLRWFAPQLPRRLSAAASTALSWVTGSCCQVSCSTFLCVAFICPLKGRKKPASRHGKTLGSRRRPWDERAQFLDRVVIFPMSR